MFPVVALRQLEVGAVEAEKIDHLFDGVEALRGPQLSALVDNEDVAEVFTGPVVAARDGGLEPFSPFGEPLALVVGAGGDKSLDAVEIVRQGHALKLARHGRSAISGTSSAESSPTVASVTDTSEPRRHARSSAYRRFRASTHPRRIPSR